MGLVAPPRVRMQGAARVVVVPQLVLVYFRSGKNHCYESMKTARLLLSL